MKKIVKNIFLISLSITLTLTILVFVFAYNDIPSREEAGITAESGIDYEVDEELHDIIDMFEELCETGLQVDAILVRLEVDGDVVVENGISIKPETYAAPSWGVGDITMQMKFRTANFPSAQVFCSSGINVQDNGISYTGVLEYVTHQSLFIDCREFQLVTYKGTIYQVTNEYY